MVALAYGKSDFKMVKKKEVPDEYIIFHSHLVILKPEPIQNGVKS